MKKAKIAVLVLLAVVLVFQGTVLAKPVSGKVAAVDVANSSISIAKVDPITGTEVKTDVAVSSTTTYTGVESLDKIAVGDSIIVDADADLTTGKLNASKVTKI